MVVKGPEGQASVGACLLPSSWATTEPLALPAKVGAALPRAVRVRHAAAKVLAWSRVDPRGRGHGEGGQGEADGAGRMLMTDGREFVVAGAVAGARLLLFQVLMQLKYSTARVGRYPAGKVSGTIMGEASGTRSALPPNRELLCWDGGSGLEREAAVPEGCSLGRWILRETDKTGEDRKRVCVAV